MTQRASERMNEPQTRAKERKNEHKGTGYKSYVVAMATHHIEVHRRGHDS